MDLAQNYSPVTVASSHHEKPQGDFVAAAAADENQAFGVNTNQSTPGKSTDTFPSLDGADCVLSNAPDSPSLTSRPTAPWESRLYVGKVSRTVKEFEIERVFERYGKITYVSHKGRYAAVQFETVAGLQAAMAGERGRVSFGEGICDLAVWRKPEEYAAYKKAYQEKGRPENPIKYRPERSLSRGRTGYANGDNQRDRMNSPHHERRGREHNRESSVVYRRESSVGAGDIPAGDAKNLVVFPFGKNPEIILFIEDPPVNEFIYDIKNALRTAGFLYALHFISSASFDNPSVFLDNYARVGTLAAAFVRSDDSREGHISKVVVLKSSPSDRHRYQEHRFQRIDQFIDLMFRTLPSKKRDIEEKSRQKNNRSSSPYKQDRKRDRSADFSSDKKFCVDAQRSQQPPQQQTQPEPLPEQVKPVAKVDVPQQQQQQTSLSPDNSNSDLMQQALVLAAIGNPAVMATANLIYQSLLAGKAPNMQQIMNPGFVGGMQGGYPPFMNGTGNPQMPGGMFNPAMMQFMAPHNMYNVPELPKMEVNSNVMDSNDKVKQAYFNPDFPIMPQNLAANLGHNAQIHGGAASTSPATPNYYGMLPQNQPFQQMSMGVPSPMHAAMQMGHNQQQPSMNEQDPAMFVNQILQSMKR